jgi:hypothetical protein
MASNADVARLTEPDHAVDQILMLVQFALPGRHEPVLPAKARLERRLVEVLGEEPAIHPAVLAFELEGARIEDVAETERVPSHPYVDLRAADRLALGVDDLNLQGRFADCFNPCECLFSPRSVDATALVRALTGANARRHQ